MQLRRVLIGFCFSVLQGLLFAQQAKPAAPPTLPQMPPALITPEVHSDDSVTFRFDLPLPRS